MEICWETSTNEYGRHLGFGGNRECVGIARDFPQFLATPINSGTGEATDIKFGRYLHFTAPSEQKPIKNSAEEGAWAYVGLL